MVVVVCAVSSQCCQGPAHAALVMLGLTLLHDPQRHVRTAGGDVIRGSASPTVDEPDPVMSGLNSVLGQAVPTNRRPQTRVAEDLQALGFLEIAAKSL